MRRFFWQVVIGVLVLGGAVAAATLNDFKDAASREECGSIPYDGIRGTCKDRGRDVDDWCKSTSRPIKCDDLDPSGLTKEIENLKQKIENLKRERDDLASKIGSAKDDSERRDLEDKKKAKADEIYKFEKMVSDRESKLSSEKTEIGNRIYNGERCVGYREDVAKAFADAKSSAKSETDPEIKPYAEQLIKKWEAGEPGHATAIRNYKAAVEKCKGMR